MEGIDDVELQLDPASLMPNADVATKLAENLTSSGVLSQQKLVSAIPAGSQPQNDYDPDWLVKAHPSCFPWGTGACPEGLSLIKWIQGTLKRYPREQFAQNAGFITDAFNIWQRHESYTQASVQFKISPFMADKMDGITESDIIAVLKLLTSGRNQNYSASFSALSPAAKTLLECMKRTGAHVIGSPQSFLSLRSKVIAGNVVFGSYTTMMNLCPSEGSSEWTFRMAGKEFKFDMFGNPDQPPSVVAKLKIIAANPKACAHYAHAYMQSFTKVLMGWPKGSHVQLNPDCLFGKINMCYLKYEVSGRLAIHAHGQMTQPILQAKHLLSMLEDGSFQKHLFRFMESFNMQYVPPHDEWHEPDPGKLCILSEPSKSCYVMQSCPRVSESNYVSFIFIQRHERRCR